MRARKRKLNGLNQRAYLEWLLTEMPNDQRLSEPGRIDRYLPWSEEVPDSYRLTKATVDEEAALPDEPIVDAEAMGALSDNS
ncbi:MAG: transposase domain-containing protein [Atopobiaceae bacterium]|nr:transposase domain-containing protein [Atopobiaceae bacterium]